MSNETREKQRMEELRRSIASGLKDLDTGKSQPAARKILEAIKARGKARLRRRQKERARYEKERAAWLSSFEGVEATRTHWPWVWLRKLRPFHLNSSR